jgi:hypothetical protein
MTLTTGERKKVLSQWTFEILVEFEPLPKDKESAYWASLQYFADVMFEQENLTAPTLELEAVTV